MSTERRLARYRERVDSALGRWLPPTDSSPLRLHQAMRYCVFGSSKRVRPALVYATGEYLGLNAVQLNGPACAVELVHTYSLVHDDLPAMDDDDLRRGRPTCHKAYDEATAILVGDALQVLAFHILASDPDITGDPATRVRMIDLLARASGTGGMAGGQAIDIAAGGTVLSVEQLEDMHARKTGRLIHASVMLAALSDARLDTATADALDTYARNIGLAFQIRDDILDVEGDVELLGKPPGSDHALGKNTYPSVLGMDEARRRADTLCKQAIEAIEPLGDAARPLFLLAEFIVRREH